MALRGLDPRGSEHGAEVRVLTRPLGDPAPAGLVRDVHHRAVDLLDPDRRGLARRDRVVDGGDRRVKAARLCQRDREHRAVAVDRVEREQDRDVQPRLLHRDVLEVIDLRRVGQAEDAAEPGLGLVVRGLPVRVELKLHQLLLQRHLLHQIVDLLLDALVGLVARGLQRDGVARA